MRIQREAFGRKLDCALSSRGMSKHSERDLGKLIHMDYYDNVDAFTLRPIETMLNLLKSLQEMGEKDKEQNPSPAGIYTMESVGKVT